MPIMGEMSMYWLKKCIRKKKKFLMCFAELVTEQSFNIPDLSQSKKYCNKL